MSSMDDRRTGWPVLLTVMLCVLVIIAALALAWWQRSSGADSGSRRDSSGSPSATAPRCGPSTCDVIDTVHAGDATVELLRSTEGKVGKLRVRRGDDEQLVDVAITRRGVPLQRGGLRCVAGATSACLVTGPHSNGVVGEVFVSHGGNWSSVGDPYFSNAGEITLDTVVRESPDVVVVEHDCGPDTELEACQEVPGRAKVYGLDGTVHGCTQSYPWPARIPGWPEIDLEGADLLPCG